MSDPSCTSAMYTYNICHSDLSNKIFRPLVKCVTEKIIFLFLNQNICIMSTVLANEICLNQHNYVLGTQKNCLNEMVLLSTQTIC